MKNSILHNRQFTKPIYSLIIFTLAFGLYANTINHGYVLDDVMVVEKNQFVHEGIAGIPDIIGNSYFAGYAKHTNIQFYRPLPLILFAIEYELTGKNPTLHHVVNVLLYALSCVFTFLLLVRIFSQKNLNILFLVVLLFTVHPLHTEVVANLKSRDIILCFLFAVLATYLFLFYLDSGKRYLLLISLICFFLSLLSKEESVTFVVLIPLTAYFFKNLPLKKSLISAGYFAGVFCIYFIIRNLIIDQTLLFQNSKILVINNSLVATDNIFERYATAILILGKYLKLLFYPHPLCIDYSYNQIPITHWTNFNVIVSFVLYLSFLAYALYSLLKKDIIGYGIIFFLITISITSNIVILIEATMGERFLFIPSLGFCIGFIFLLKQLVKSTLHFRLIISVLVLLFSFKTIQRNIDWNNEFRLYASDIRKSPQSAKLNKFYAHAHVDKSKQQNSEEKRILYLQKALYYAKRSLEIYPDNYRVLNTTGSIYYSLGKPELAIKDLKKSIALEPTNAKALMSVGILYLNQKEFDKALYYFQKYRKINPNDPVAVKNIINIYIQQNKNHKAITLLNKLIDVFPDDIVLYQYMAQAHLNIQELSEAEKYLKRAIKIAPQNFELLHNLGVVLQKENKTKKAIEYYVRSMKSNPEFIDNFIKLGLIYKDTDNHNKAIELLTHAYIRQPDNQLINRNLYELHKAIGNKEKALLYKNQIKK